MAQLQNNSILVQYMWHSLSQTILAVQNSDDTHAHECFQQSHTSTNNLKRHHKNYPTHKKYLGLSTAILAILAGSYFHSMLIYVVME